MGGLRGEFKGQMTGLRNRTLRGISDVAGAVDDLAAFTSRTADFLRELGRIEILRGTIVDVVFDGVSINKVIRHGLGRRFRGAIMIGQTLRSPDTTVILPGGPGVADDSDTLILFQQQGVATALTARFWVF